VRTELTTKGCGRGRRTSVFTEQRAPSLDWYLLLALWESGAPHRTTRDFNRIRRVMSLAKEVGA